jgi:hypothetical protein
VVVTCVHFVGLDYFSGSGDIRQMCVSVHHDLHYLRHNNYFILKNDYARPPSCTDKHAYNDHGDDFDLYEQDPNDDFACDDVVLDDDLERWRVVERVLDTGVVRPRAHHKRRCRHHR